MTTASTSPCASTAILRMYLLAFGLNACAWSASRLPKWNFR